MPSIIENAINSQKRQSMSRKYYDNRLMRLITKVNSLIRKHMQQNTATCQQVVARARHGAFSENTIQNHLRPVDRPRPRTLGAKRCRRLVGIVWSFLWENIEIIGSKAPGNDSHQVWSNKMSVYDWKDQHFQTP